jgi:tetratricopeptide (TPR) repeat protein
MYQRALQGYEKAWGLDHTSTLDTVNNLGSLYADLGRLDEAEKMYQRATQGYEKALPSVASKRFLDIRANGTKMSFQHWQICMMVRDGTVGR